MKRYDISRMGGMSMEESPDGAYVHIDDVTALEQHAARGWREAHEQDTMLQEYRKAAGEPAGWQVKKHGGNWESIKEKDVHHYRFNEELPVREIYTAPQPAPAVEAVPVAQDLKSVGFLFISDKGAVAYSPINSPMEGFTLIGKIYGYANSCRAAMLKGDKS